jgi:hypothetical protein
MSRSFLIAYRCQSDEEIITRLDSLNIHDGWRTHLRDNQVAITGITNNSITESKLQKWLDTLMLKLSTSDYKVIQWCNGVEHEFGFFEHSFNIERIQTYHIDN